MRLVPQLMGLLLMGCVSHVQAQISVGGTTYRCVDGAGRSTYTNVKEEMGGKKCTVVSREVSVVPAQAPARPAPAARTGSQPASSTSSAASRSNSDAQRARDSDRRRILEQELQSAEKQLAEARQKLADQEAIRNGNERNYARVLERLKPFQDEVRVAEENVSALKRELSNLR